MKRGIILMLIAICFTLTSVLASVPAVYDTKGETLSLYNDGTGGASPGTRPRMFSIPLINATIEKGRYIDAYFHTIEILEIEITDSMGFVRDMKTVDTTVTKQLHIDISTLPSGEYKIKFKKKTGGETLSGDFAIN